MEELERSGLVGRGGAGFPAATKMRAVAAAKGRAIVVANGTEGEPASMKDRTLMQTLPHMIIDGGVIAAEAVGADELIIAVCESSQESIDAVALAIEERGEDAQHSPKVQLARIPAHYSAGQETALVNFLGGGPSLPTFTPPRVFEQGIGKRPTLVNNVETLAHIALISRHGPRWFRQLGTPSQPGSTLVTLSGAVAHPGVYEIETGASLTSLIEAGGGPTARMRGALFGGYGGSWVAGEYLRGDRALKRTPRSARREPRRGGRAPALRGCMPRRGNRPCRALDARPERPPVRPLHPWPGRSRGHARTDRRRRSAREGGPADQPARVADGTPRGVRAPRRHGQDDPQRRRGVRHRVRRPRAPRPLRAVLAGAGAAAARPAAEHAPAARQRSAQVSRRVRVNPITCEAHGMCAELLPERITLDEWGYPIVDGAPLTGSQVEHATRAARACPTFALLVDNQRD